MNIYLISKLYKEKVNHYLIILLFSHCRICAILTVIHQCCTRTMLQTYVTSGSSLSHGQQARNTSVADDIEVEFPASVWNLKYNNLVVIYVKTVLCQITHVPNWKEILCRFLSLSKSMLTSFYIHDDFCCTRVHILYLWLLCMICYWLLKTYNYNKSKYLHIFTMFCFCYMWSIVAFI